MCSIWGMFQRSGIQNFLRFSSNFELTIVSIVRHWKVVVNLEIFPEYRDEHLKNWTTLWFWRFWCSLAPHLVGKYIKSLAPNRSPNITGFCSTTTQVVSSPPNSLQLFVLSSLVGLRQKQHLWRCSRATFGPGEFAGWPWGLPIS